MKILLGGINSILNIVGENIIGFEIEKIVCVKWSIERKKDWKVLNRVSVIIGYY